MAQEMDTFLPAKVKFITYGTGPEKPQKEISLTSCLFELIF